MLRTFLLMLTAFVLMDVLCTAIELLLTLMLRTFLLMLTTFVLMASDRSFL